MEDTKDVFEEFATDIQQEGEPLAGENKQEDVPAESSTEKEEGGSPSQQGEEAGTDTVDNTDAQDKPEPFHKNPRWQRMMAERQADRKKIEELESKITSVPSSAVEPMPDWFVDMFGDNPMAWDKWQNQSRNQQQSLKQEIISEIEGKQRQEQEQIKQFESWANDELDALEDEGLTFNRDKLIQIADKFRPTNNDGLPDFRKAYEILHQQEMVAEIEKKAKATSIADEKKKAGAMTSSDNRGEATDSGWVSSKDVRKWR